MKKRQILICVLACWMAAPCLLAQKLDKIVVDQAWLQKRMDDKNLVILHVTDPKKYEEGHIKGAQLIEPREYAVRKGNLSWELPDPDTLSQVLRSKGIDDHSRIVLYYGGDHHAATFRLYFTLDYFGLSGNTFILDGGLKGWKSNGLETTAEANTPTVKPEGSLTLTADPSLKVDKDYVRGTASKDDVNLIDARRSKYYQGAKETEEHYKRTGHIAGAENICWLDIVDDRMFLKDKATLTAYYQQAGVRRKEEVVAYCHVGLRASVIYTIAKGLGYKARLYDGSYNEWDTLPEAYEVKKGTGNQ